MNKRKQLSRNTIRLRSYGKINLSIDVKGLIDGGYHEVDMIMAQIGLYDDILIRWFKNNTSDSIEVDLGINLPYVPRDSRNIAFKAASIMAEKYGKGRSGRIRIDIYKRIPVAAGLAGGSANGATVIHGLNKLWGLKLSLEEMCSIGSRLGADVPFCIAAQAKVNFRQSSPLQSNPKAAVVARATGIGTELAPLKSIDSWVVVAKPPMSISTKQVYQNIDEYMGNRRPDTAKVIEAIEEKDFAKIKKYAYNVLEDYTLKEYNAPRELKNSMNQFAKESLVQMTGSGPTIIGLCGENKKEAEEIYINAKNLVEEAYLVKITSVE